MAKYKHLPIYKLTYDLLSEITKVTKQFSKDFKYSLGAKIRDEAVELVVFIYKANSSRENREANVKLLLERLQIIELLLRLSKDMRLISSVNKIEHGVNFVGYILKPRRKYIRRSTLSNLLKKMEDQNFWKDDDVIASANSYLGMLRQVNGYNARKKICQRFDWLGYDSDKQLTKLVN